MSDPFGRIAKDKQEKMKKIEEELGIVPETSGSSFRSHFITATPEPTTRSGMVISVVGETGTGKTTEGILLVKCNEIDCVEEIESWGLPSKSHEIVTEAMVNAYKTRGLLPCKELFVFGTEMSTEECLYSEDNHSLFIDHLTKNQIHYKEIYIRNDKKEVMESGIDAIKSMKKYNEIVSSLVADIETEREMKSGLLLDSESTFFGWCNEVMRRNVMKLPRSKREQGVPPRYWFWRNTKMEDTSLLFRSLNLPVWQTWKFKKDKDGYYSIPNWHDTSGHNSSVILYKYQLKDNKKFYTLVDKCRRKNSLVGETFQMTTPNMIFACMIGLDKYLEPIMKVESKERIKLKMLRS